MYIKNVADTMHLDCVVMQQRYINYNLHCLFYAFLVCRPRYTASTIVSIEDLNSRRTGQIFVGDIMAVYNTYLDKTNKSRRILRADMTDEKGIMTITLIVPTHLIRKHEQKILPGNGLSITHFKILPKTNYDRGDCDRIISLDEFSVVETIVVVCKEYNFIPDTTIKQFTESTTPYPIGAIGVVVTVAKKVGMQYILHIKDGNSENDKATVQLPYLVLLLSNLYILNKIT
jgi:hypothetical protein